MSTPTETETAAPKRRQAKKTVGGPSREQFIADTYIAFFAQRGTGGLSEGTLGAIERNVEKVWESYCRARDAV